MAYDIKKINLWNMEQCIFRVQYTAKTYTSNSSEKWYIKSEKNLIV